MPCQAIEAEYPSPTGAIRVANHPVTILIKDALAERATSGSGDWILTGQYASAPINSLLTSASCNVFLRVGPKHRRIIEICQSGSDVVRRMHLSGPDDARSRLRIGFLRSFDLRLSHVGWGLTQQYLYI